MSSYEDTKAGAISGARAMVVRHVAVAVLKLAGTTYLVRQLGPEPWAAFTIAYYLVTFLDQHLSVSLLGQLVRSPEFPDRRHLASAAWMMQAVGAALLIGCLLLSAPAADLYGRSELSYCLIGAGFCAYVYSIRSVSAAMIERRLGYQTIAIAEIADQVTFLAVAVPLVAVGGGIEAVAVALGLRGVAAAAYLRSRFAVPFLGQRDPPTRHEILTFGYPSMAMSSVFFVNGLVPLFVLGGDDARELAFVMTSGTVIGYIAIFLVVTQRVAFPALAGLQLEPDQFRQGLQRLIGLSNTVLVATAIPATATAPLWLPALFGDEWEPAGMVATVLGVGLLLSTYTNILTSALNSIGRPRSAFTLWAVMTGLYLVIAFPLAEVTLLFSTPIALLVARVVGAVVAVRLLRDAGHVIAWRGGILFLIVTSGVLLYTASLFDDGLILEGTALGASLAAVTLLLRRRDIPVIVSAMRSGLAR